MTNQISRRAVLSAAPAALASLPALTPLAAQAEGQSPLRALYFRWQAVKDEFSALPPDCDEETEDPIFSEMRRLEQQAADFEPRTMEDLIFKIIFADDNGDMSMNLHQSALVARAYAIAGVEPRIIKGA